MSAPLKRPFANRGSSLFITPHHSSLFTILLLFLSRPSSFIPRRSSACSSAVCPWSFVPRPWSLLFAVLAVRRPPPAARHRLLRPVRTIIISGSQTIVTVSAVCRPLTLSSQSVSQSVSQPVSQRGSRSSVRVGASPQPTAPQRHSPQRLLFPFSFFLFPFSFFLFSNSTTQHAHATCLRGLLKCS